jgi:hypothetical protein
LTPRGHPPPATSLESSKEMNFKFEFSHFDYPRINFWSSQIASILKFLVSCNQIGLNRHPESFCVPRHRLKRCNIISFRKWNYSARLSRAFTGGFRSSRHNGWCRALSVMDDPLSSSSFIEGNNLLFISPRNRGTNERTRERKRTPREEERSRMKMSSKSTKTKSTRRLRP